MLSIIIVIKNHRIVKKLLKKLIQIPKPEKTEIVVVDASEGNLDDIKKKFSSVKWIYFYSKEKYTIPKQRNLGIKKSKGDIIVFIDADCIPTKNWLTNLIKPIREEKENIVTGFTKSFRRFPRKWEADYKRITNKKYVDFATTMNTAFKRTVFDTVGVYDKTFKFGGEDTDLCWKAVDAGYKIRYNPKAVIYHDWGNLKRNIIRQFIYGKVGFHVFKKHPKKMLKIDNVALLAYPLYILLIPITFVWFYYPLFILIPFIKNLFEMKSVEISLETIIFNLINGAGFITEGLLYIFKQ